jgi:hypothetical protein
LNRLTKNHTLIWNAFPLALKCPANGKAESLKIVEGEYITVISETVNISLPVRIETDWPKDHLGISIGYKQTASVELDSMVRLEKTEKKDG